jgi:hypothetical protein
MVEPEWQVHVLEDSMSESGELGPASVALGPANLEPCLPARYIAVDTQPKVKHERWTYCKAKILSTWTSFDLIASEKSLST